MKLAQNYRNIIRGANKNGNCYPDFDSSKT